MKQETCYLNMLSITETHIHFLVIVAFNIFLIPPCWTKLCIGGVNIFLFIDRSIQKQPRRSVLRKRCSKVMQQIYRRAPMPKRSFNEVASNFIEIALRHGCSPINLLHISGKPFPKNTSGVLLYILFHFPWLKRNLPLIINFS